jgi:hypothetical protein
MLLLLMGYILAAMRPLPPQPKLERQWTVHLDQAPVAERDEAEQTLTEWIPFYTGAEFGYISPGGDVLLREEVLDGTALSSTAYVNYTTLGEALVLQMPREEYMYTIDNEGIPFFRGSRLWLLSPDHMGISAVSEEGETRYSLRFGTVVTSVDAGKNITAVGLLDGTVRLFNNAGELLWNLNSGESNEGVIYGVAVSPGGKQVAYVSGLEPQRLHVHTIAESGTVPVYERQLEPAVRRELQLDYSEDGTLLLVETASGALIRNVQFEQERFIPLQGELTDYLLEGAGQPVFLSTARNRHGTLTVSSVEEGDYTREDYPAAVTALERAGEAVYVCTSGAVHKVRMVSE